MVNPFLDIAIPGSRILRFLSFDPEVFDRISQVEVRGRAVDSFIDNLIPSIVGLQGLK